MLLSLTEPSIQLKEERNYADMSEFLKAYGDKCQLSVVGVKENRIMSRQEHSSNKISKPEKVPVFNVSASPDDL